MNILALTIILPLIGFVLLVFSCGHWSRNVSVTVNVGSVGLAALVTVFIGVNPFANGEQAYSQPLRAWMSVGDPNIGFNLVLDGLSLTMLLAVTSVGFLIHMYASQYIHDEEGYSRFFAYTNPFITSTVVLVLADNLLLMYLGWEGVGLCSYLLTGFYYTGPKNGAATIKAFAIIRVGDVFLAFALFILYSELGTPNFREMVELAPAHFADNNNVLMWAALMLLGGTVGKSVRLPLQIWLADAMVGSTSVPALIHTAAVITAGVYLIVCIHGPFPMTPEALRSAGIARVVTLLLAGFTVLVQTDIRRTLACPTMSQIGYMLLTFDVQTWDAAIFHSMTYTFFKTLLSLASGSVILACHHEQNILKMGGLRKSILLAYLCFLVGSAALLALPLVTAGFPSKDETPTGAMADGHTSLMVAGLVGALMTSLYIFRMIFIVSHGEEQTHAHAAKGVTHSLSLTMLLILSTSAGVLIIPPLQDALPQTTELVHGSVLTLEIASGMVAVVSIPLAAWLRLGKRILVTSIANSASSRLLDTWRYNAQGFDWLCDKVFVKPFLDIAQLLERGPLNSMMNIPAILPRLTGKGLLLSENGYLRWYVASMSTGAVVVPALLTVLRRIKDCGTTPGRIGTQVG